MGRKAKSPEPEPQKPSWIPSKLPTIFEHAALAATLLVRREGKPPSDGQIAEAVSTAARLWAAVLEHGSENAVEQARFTFASRRSDAEARWHRWQNRKLGIEEDAEKAKRELGRWTERADDCFEGLEFPASADDVLGRIMKQRRTDESSPGSRSVRFGRVWLEWALAAEAQRWENIRSNDGRLPSEHTLLDEAMCRRQAAIDAGEAEPAWPYEGKAGAEKLRKELVKRVNAFLSAEENEIKAARLALEQQAGELRKLTLERTEAALWFRLWKEHVSQEGRDKGGEQTRIKLGGTKKKVTSRPKKL